MVTSKTVTLARWP